MKNIILFTIIFLVTFSLYAQCPTKGIVFGNQSQIDSFIIEYPNCDSLPYIRFVDDGLIDPISNFNGLKNIKYINSSIELPYLGSLSDVSGLNNVEFINGNLIINFDSNSIIKNLFIFNNLKIINGNLEVYSNSFDTLSGLNSIEVIEGGLYIHNNRTLSIFESLGKANILKRVVVNQNQNLKDLNFLNKIEIISGQFSIGDLDSLKNLNGLSSLKSVKSLFIYENSSLTNISGLKNLSKLGSSSSSLLKISNNNSLTSLSGLDSLDMSTVSQLNITDNKSLSFCSLENICDYLSSAFNNAKVIGNASDCTTIQKIIDKCESPSGISQGTGVENISIQPNPIKEYFLIKGIDENFELNIFDMFGEKVYYKELQNENKFDISNLKNGVYMVCISNKNIEKVIKIIKTK